jgi:hypothetical protein
MDLVTRIKREIELGIYPELNPGVIAVVVDKIAEVIGAPEVLTSEQSHAQRNISGTEDDPQPE